MPDGLYEFFRGGAGFTLMVAGIALLIEPGRPRVRRSYGVLNLSVGSLFCLSTLDPVMRLPLDIGNLLVANLIFVLGIATYNMVLFVFGGQRKRGLARRMFWIGLVWAQVMWLFPLLDYGFGLPVLATSPEDGHALPPLHLVSSFLVYAWPIAVCALPFRHSRWRLADIPGKEKESRHLVQGVHAAGLILALVVLSLVLDQPLLYRIGQMVLQLFLLVWYFVMVRNPLALSRIRHEIQENHERRVNLDADETATIAQRLDQLVGEEVFRRPDLGLGGLAALVRVPPYRLSRYFNDHLDTSFPVWLNELRINWVCARMVADPDSSLLELSNDAGFGSKTTFNTQFVRVKGMSPTEFRKVSATREVSP